MTSTKKKLPRFLVPALFLGTAALAATLWIVPINFKVPGQSTAAPKADNALARARQGGSSQGPAVKPSSWSRPTTPPWTDLTEKFAAIRPDPPETIAGDDPDTPSTIEPPESKLDWTFMGSIIHDSLRVAQVRIGDDPRQRFFFEGDVIPDPSEEDEDGIKIVSVTEQILTVSWLDRDHELRLGEEGSEVVAVAEADPGTEFRDPAAERARDMRAPERPDPASQPDKIHGLAPPRGDLRRYPNGRPPRPRPSAAPATDPVKSPASPGRTAPASAERPS